LIPLSHQHHNGLALCVLTERGLAAESSEESVRNLAQRIVDRYEIELINHFEMEEQLLFPLCPGPLADELIGEHRELERMVQGLSAAPTAERLTEFSGLLRRHIRREESEYFQQVQEQVPRDQLDAAGAEIDRKAVRVCL
jgi:hemerythrin-like domain-containing protein